jgi:ankyrin repeat protein
MKTMPFRYIAIFPVVTLMWSIPPAGAGEIHEATKRGDLETVKALLKEDPALALSKDDTGWTPLNLAAQKGFKGLAKLLLANKVRVNAKDKDEITPLKRATVQGHSEVTELLRQRGGHA